VKNSRTAYIIAELIIKDLFGKTEKEYRFTPERRWRFDFAIPELKIAIEIEGGIWTNGRHSRGSGYTKDLEKYNTATALGWRIFRFSYNQIQDGEMVKFLIKLRGDGL